MNTNFIWIYVLVIRFHHVISRPVQDDGNTHTTGQQFPYNPGSSEYESLPNHNDEKVISVRITSSVAIGRGNARPIQRVDSESRKEHYTVTKTTTELPEHNENSDPITDLPPNLRGANIEFIKQLNAKKVTQEQGDHFQTSALRYDDGDKRISYETKNEQTDTNDESIPRASKILSSDEFIGFKLKSISILEDALKLVDERRSPNNTDNEDFTESNPATDNAYLSTLYEESEYNEDDKDNYSHLDYNKESKEIDDSIAESSVKSVSEIENKNSEDYENIENVPLARSLGLSPSSKNYIQGLSDKQLNERESSTRLTTVSFNIVHDAPKTSNFDDPGKSYVSPSQPFPERNKFYDSPIIYSRPSQIYSEPAKVYSEPAKVYSEPAKIYSEPAKVYSEPSKIYSEPAKFYSEPASLHLKPSVPKTYSPWQPSSPPSVPTTHNTTPVTAITIPGSGNNPQQQPETNYEVDEKVSVFTDGRSHGEQETSTEKCKQENCKVGYVVKGRQFNKYRVEERTSDGFIVGEYGVVRNEDGALRGVRYTADSEASPRLIYDALMKFLQLK